MKKLFVIPVSFVSLFFFAAPAFAHVIVNPSQIGVATMQEFSMSVPTEKDTPTVAVRLLIPNGVKMVTPNVKAGWTITEKENGSGDSASVTEIDWTGGSIPPGQRDDFLFQAQVPAKETTLDWKAYQTYEDGTVVSWDHDPKLSKGPDDDAAPPPYSTTKIVNDLTGSPTQVTQSPETPNRALWIGLVALALSAVAISMQLRREK